jgi:hypothetical protein
MKKYLISLCTFCILFNVQGQISTEELPISWNRSLNLKEYALKEVIVPTLDSIQIRKKDSIYGKRFPKELRVEPDAYGIPVHFTLENSGEWQTLEDGSKLWRLKIKLPGAYSIDVVYDKFWLPEGTIFYAYSNETKEYYVHKHKEYLSKENPSGYASGFLHGETAVLEYYQPAWVQDTAIISVSMLGYGYKFKSRFKFENTKDTGVL